MKTSILLTIILAMLAAPLQAKNKLRLGFLMFDGLHVTPDGRRFGAEGATGTHVYEIKENGEVVIFASGFAGPIDITNDRAGNLFVTNFNSASVSKISPDGEVTEFASTLVGPAGITIDKEDNLFVAQFGEGNGTGDTILKIDPQGVVSTFAQGDLLSVPLGMTIDDEGNLYSANFHDGRIVKHTPQGEQTLFGTIESPFGFAIGHIEHVKDRIFATGLADSKIYVVRKRGRVRAKNIVENNEFPNGIALDKTRNQLIFTNVFAVSFGLDRITLPRNLFFETQDSQREVDWSEAEF